MVGMETETDARIVSEVELTGLAESLDMGNEKKGDY